VYKAYFNLRDYPFRLTPDPAYFYVTERHREALAGLSYRAGNRSGLVVLTGEAGTGKTTLIYVLRQWLEKGSCRVALCTNPTLTRDEFIDLLIMRFGVECESTLKTRRVQALEDALIKMLEAGARPVLVIDEAHRLSPELLEEVRLLLNLETAKEKLLDIVLAGQPELSLMLRRDDLRQLRQRVSAYFLLKPFDAREVAEYIVHRMSVAGMPGQTVFSQEVCDLVFWYTRGIPRLVCTLCDNAMLTAFALQERTVSIQILKEAAEDLTLVPDGAALVPPESIQAVAAAAAGASVLPDAIPLESYQARQRSFGFLGSLIGRLK
jgi:general secretion pathway protein A